MEDIYVIKEGKELRCGYTTGSCAAGAAKAAALMLEKAEIVEYVQIDTPSGIHLNLKVNNQKIYGNWATCSITKDGGDDPDSTDGMEIHALVKKRKDGLNVIDGGQGIGRIMRKGLFGNIGEAAINPVPRQMIDKEVSEVSKSGYDIIIYAPKGEEISRKTYNKNIGIEGGISIIGTKGIVYPMSEDALINTIYLEVDMIEEKFGKDNIILVPGNYGGKIADSLNMKESRVKMSNYIGDTILYIYNKGFKSMTLIGHIGKFSKLSIGIFNTHSKVCDGRMEAFVYYLALRGASTELLQRINRSITAEEALSSCIEAGYGEIVRDMAKGCQDRITKYLKDENYPVEVIIFSMERGVFMG